MKSAWCGKFSLMKPNWCNMKCDFSFQTRRDEHAKLSKFYNFYKPTGLRNKPTRGILKGKFPPRQEFILVMWLELLVICVIQISFSFHRFLW